MLFSAGCVEFLGVFFCVYAREEKTIGHRRGRPIMSKENRTFLP